MAKSNRKTSDRRRSIPRIPFFRIFYSATYTAIYILCLLILAVTPISTLWAAIQNQAFQYVFMIGGAYVLTAIIAIVVYSSRIYSNRSTLAAVGKPYVPIEKGEVGKSVRKMIAKQLEKSAIVAWESRPRDLYGEIVLAEDTGVLPPETKSIGRDDYTVGVIVPIDPAKSPWGDVQHPGWSSPSHSEQNKYPGVRFSDVIAEIPNLIEARAVSLAPVVPAAATFDNDAASTQPDETIVNILRRPLTAGLRQYLTQLAYLQLIAPPDLGEKFLILYERARFSESPTTEKEFNELMAVFSQLLAGMVALHPAIIEQIRLQSAEDTASMASSTQHSVMVQNETYATEYNVGIDRTGAGVVDPDMSSGTSAGQVALKLPYLPLRLDSSDSFASVIRRTSQFAMPALETPNSEHPPHSSSSLSLPSNSGSMIRHGSHFEDG